MKRTRIIVLMLCAVSAAWAVTVMDDFNRADTASSSDTTLIGANWTQASGSANRWRIGGNTVYAQTSAAPGILFNTAWPTDSGNGDHFTVSLDVAGQAVSVWAGVAFNYNNPSNYYTVRFKTGYDDYQFLGKRSDGSWKVIGTGHATANFVAGTFYTISVSSDTAHTYSFTIKDAGSGALRAQRPGIVDNESLCTGGYAGLSLDTANATTEYARFDNFRLEVIPRLPRSALFMAILSTQPALSNLEATVRSGQVFLTWKEAPVPEGTTFCVFLHDQPITAETLQQARQVGHHIEAGSACDWWKDPASFDINATPNRTHGFLIDGEELDARDGLFVHTITEEDPSTMYFAVLSSSSDTVINSVSIQGTPAFPEPFQLQNAPASNSAAGGSLTLDLHGRGGGTDANNQANFLLFGDGLQGWREGLARKFVVESDGGNLVIKPLDRMWINRPLMYSWDQRDHVPAINTWWYGCNDHIYDAAAVSNGVVVNYTEEHLLYLVRWAQRYFGTDPQRTTITGISMGGSGAISMGFHHPDVFAAIFSDVPIPAYTRRAGSDGRYNLPRLDGLCGRPCDETVMSSDGIPVMERMDSERIALEYPGELPFLVLCNGRNDGSMPWVNNPFFYRALNQGRRGFSCYWNDGAHDMGSFIPQDTRDFYSLHPDMALDASYPAFSNCSDNRDPGDGEKTDGDIIGWMNRGIYWTVPEEAGTAWSTSLSIDGDFLPESVTVDVTPRNLTVFDIDPNEILLVNGSELQADENGLLTISSVQIHKGVPVQLLIQRR